MSSKSGLSSTNLAIILAIVIGVFVIFLAFVAKYSWRKYSEKRLQNDAENTSFIPMKDSSANFKVEQNLSKIKTITGVEIFEKIGTGSTSQGKFFSGIFR